ncbi:ABC transporter substrate-binding protein [Flexibacterium corallicola]|uniref:ABC transporter substrate-binding protein n=1 Tax=Flexibacterium corallicola TaxID=3037259 RepID=UPI00286EEF0D|nr:ABC transporter substrate-binding protein [Pseudovibrio sp. M1P-2-3]
MRIVFEVPKFILIVVAILLTSTVAYGQQQKTVVVSSWSGYPDNVKGFKDALAQAGLIEGQTVQFINLTSGPNSDRLRQELEALDGANIDLVYSLTTPGTSVVKEVIPSSVPIVFSIVTYPADSGLIESFDYSGNNLVGTSNYVPLRYYVELLNQILPDASEAAIFHRTGEPNSKIQASNLVRLLKRKGVNAVDIEAANVGELKNKATEIAPDVDVFITTTDTLMQSGGEDALIQISLDEGVPILSSNKSGIQAGSTFGPVVDFYFLGKMAGDMAVSILNEGVRPSDLQSQLQEPPLTLLNRDSIQKLDVQIEPSLHGLIYIDQNSSRK